MMNDIFWTENISPLQGLMDLYLHYRIGRCPMLGYYAPSARRSFINCSIALKWLHIITQDNVILGANTILFSPERAIYYKTGQRPVYQRYNDYQPCKGNILQNRTPSCLPYTQ